MPLWEGVLPSPPFPLWAVLLAHLPPFFVGGVSLTPSPSLSLVGGVACSSSSLLRGAAFLRLLWVVLPFLLSVDWNEMKNSCNNTSPS